METQLCKVTPAMTMMIGAKLEASRPALSDIFDMTVIGFVLPEQQSLRGRD
jgi:hypothetical protein